MFLFFIPFLFIQYGGTLHSSNLGFAQPSISVLETVYRMVITGTFENIEGRTKDLILFVELTPICDVKFVHKNVVIQGTSYQNWATVSCSEQISEEVIQKWREKPGVEVHYFSSLNDENVIATAPMYHLDMLNQEKGPLDGYLSDSSVYQYMSKNTPKTLVIMDTGVQSKHPEFLREDGTSRVKKIADFLHNPRQDPYEDTHGHGTICAGMAVGKTVGILKESDFYIAKIYSGGTFSPDVSADAFITIANMALNGSLKRPVVISYSFQLLVSWARMHTPSGNSTYQAHLRLVAAMKYAIRNGVVIVMAAGNHNFDICQLSLDMQNDDLYAPQFQDSFLRENIIFVGGVGSNYKKPLFGLTGSSNWGECITIYAPSSNIRSSSLFSENINNHSGKQYYMTSLSGTSLSAPLVASTLIGYLSEEKNLPSRASLSAMSKSILRAQSSWNLWNEYIGYVPVLQMLNTRRECKK